MKTAAFSKAYRGRTVLRLPQLELPAGEITALVGPNGSGKSTLAKVLAGIEPADGKAPALTGCSVGYLPQKSFAFRMSTRRNVLLNGGDPARADQLLRALGLETLARQRAWKLSGGETAKMALCRILMGSYGLLILDEPTAALDMESTLAAEELIRRRCRETGCAVLLITHSIQQARRLSARMLLLHRGRAGGAGRDRAAAPGPGKRRDPAFPAVLRPLSRDRNRGGDPFGSEREDRGTICAGPAGGAAARHGLYRAHRHRLCRRQGQGRAGRPARAAAG